MRRRFTVRHYIVLIGALAAIAVSVISYTLHRRGGGEKSTMSAAAPHKQAAGDDSTETDQPLSYTYRIKNIFPHDPGAFTQGLTFSDGMLYEGTGGSGISTLRKVELETGTIIQSKRVRGHYFGEGITIYRDRIIQLTYVSHTGLVYDKETLELLERFTYPTEGWGLTHDGTHLIMSDGTARLYFLDPDTYERKRRLEVRDDQGPVPFLNELEYIRGAVYANIWQADDIAVIDPETGRVTAYIHLYGLIDPAAMDNPVDVLNGIAYDEKNNRLFVTGKLWPELFEIELVAME